MMVFDLSEEADDDLLWSTLEMPEGGCPSVSPLFAQLGMLGIPEPKGFWECVEMRDGNVITTYVDGKWHRREF
jgi:hypothetical protein